jgi:hypothetical protein
MKVLPRQGHAYSCSTTTSATLASVATRAAVRQAQRVARASPAAAQVGLDAARPRRLLAALDAAPSRAGLSSWRSKTGTPRCRCRGCRADGGGRPVGAVRLPRPDGRLAVTAAGFYPWACQQAQLGRRPPVPRDQRLPRLAYSSAPSCMRSTPVDGGRHPARCPARVLHAGRGRRSGPRRRAHRPRRHWLGSDPRHSDYVLDARNRMVKLAVELL